VTAAPAVAERALVVTVPGKPRPQGSMTLWRAQDGSERAKYAPEVVQHRNLLVGSLMDSWGGREALSGPTALRLRFAFARPSGHYLPANRRRPERELRLDAPAWHISAPDLDKLVRCVADALTIASVWRDDALMSLVRAEKCWDETAYTTIEVVPL